MDVKISLFSQAQMYRIFVSWKHKGIIYKQNASCDWREQYIVQMLYVNSILK